MTLSELAQLTLTSGGTAEAISATPLHPESVIFTAASTNSGAVYIGSEDVSDERFVKKLAAGESFSISVNPSAENDNAFIKLQDVYWDGTTGDKLNVGYLVNS